TKFNCSLANPDEPKPSATVKPSAPSFKPFKKEEVMRNNLPNALPRWKKKKPNQKRLAKRHQKRPGTMPGLWCVFSFLV
ncbi:uncharacterized protein METZ01_LOCUS212389, partial [marine metagenome]